MSQDVGQELVRLVEIMRRLRAEGGCPWDREQDLRSLRPYLIEEAYEVLDEMDAVSYGNASWKELCGELGDLLFQIVFHAQLATELGEFDMGDVCAAISDKIVSRHPHVFGDKQVTGATQVLENWAKLKAEERRKKHGHEGSVLDGVPSAAPALLRAERLTEKASRIGFDWPDLAGVRAKLDEELRELDEAIARNDRDELDHELGDVLFSLANLSRFIKTPPEDALRHANRRFTTRFQQIEKALRDEGVPFGGATLEQMEVHWQKAKAQEKAVPPPRSLPRVPVARLRVPVPSVAAQRAFFERLAPTLGWTAVHGDEDQACFTDGALELSFHAGAVNAGLAFELEAPSAAAVDALHAVLRQQAAPAAPPADEHGRYGVTFRDPAGLPWSYRTA